MKLLQVTPLLRRVPRTRRSYAAIPDGQPSDATKASVTLKRFWKEVSLDQHSDTGFRVKLDGKPIRTPSNHPLVIPKNRKLLAAMVAHEWDSQDKLLKTHALPLTSIVSRVQELEHDSFLRSGVEDSLLKYLDTDTICFHGSEPPILVKLQNEHWVPLLGWVEETFKAKIDTFDSVLFGKQPDTTKKIMKGVLSEMDCWSLAAMERATLTTKSFLIALALVKGRLDVEGASAASLVEVTSQIQRWGEVEDTHDVDHQDVRRQLGSVALVLAQQS